MATLKQKYGSTALVTGASSGIGEAFAREFARQGLDLILVARRGEILQRLSNELTQAHGIRVMVLAQDLAAPDAAQKIQAQTAAAGWTVDILVNNAGFGTYGELEKTDLARNLAMIDVHCRAVVALTHAFIPPMKVRRRGAIIIVSSVLGAMPGPFMSTYAATKSFDLNFGESLNGELKPYGVDVLAVMPTLTETGFDTGTELKRMPVSKRSAEDVVRTTLGALGRKPSVADGPQAKFLLFLLKFIPRTAYLWAYRFFRTPDDAK
jgi:short-subunit dehydrogenase